MKSIRSGFKTAIVLGCVAFTSIAFAHHSPNVHFDRTQTVEFTGELIEISWRNPHVLMTVRSTNDEGEGVVWDLEYLAPSFLSRQGITSDLFSVGDIIRVAGFPARSNEHAVFTTNILAANGQEVFDFQIAEARFTNNTVGLTFAEYQDTRKVDLPQTAESIFRVWSTDVSLIGPDRTMWQDSYPLTEQAQTAHANWDRVADNPYIRCENGMLAIMDQFFPMEIAAAGDNIVIHLEELDMIRTVYMTNSFPLPSPSPLGHSVGRWDGETLVVSTTQVTWPWFDQTGVPQTDAVEFSERFTLSENGLRLNYSVRATDPDTFTEPVVLTRDWVWLPGETVQPYECTIQEGKY